MREILKCQETDQSWKQPQVRLRIAWSSFVRDFGPINTTVVSSVEDEETGEVRETHRRPNLAPFADDPDCWLVASIEDYDLESNTAKPGPIFTERVIAPPPAPVITSAVDALAVVLNERGAVDPAHVAELLHGDVDAVIAELGDAIFRDPENGSWLTADAYLSGAVRSKLAAARAAAELDPAFARNVAALERVQPPDLRPSDITARLGAPWIPAADIIAFVKETMDADITIHHTAELACWTVNARQLSWTAAGTTEWGTHRRHAGELLVGRAQLVDPADLRHGEGRRQRAARSQHRRDRGGEGEARQDQDRVPDLDLVRSGSHRSAGAALQRHASTTSCPVTSTGSHLQLPGASGAFSLYGHQKRAIWRIISSGSTYVAHAVGAGKTLSIAAAIMEQRRLGLINKAMLVVPGHCLAQAAREFLALYPNARILVADETNFVKEKRHRFLSRAATANWDAIIITHSRLQVHSRPVRLRAADAAGRA